MKSHSVTDLFFCGEHKVVESRPEVIFCVDGTRTLYITLVNSLSPARPMSC